ncbi:MAG: hypothetical protein AMXMBFR83_23520 [Phycisphaerae bacterium]
MCFFVPGLIAVPAAAHVDILIGREGNSIVTGGYDFDALPGDPVIPSPVRVFGYDFGEIPGQPDVSQDPGCISLPGVFVPGTVFTLRNLGTLEHWDGNGAVNFSAPPNGESLLMEKGAGSMTIGAPGGLLTLGVTPGAAFGQDLHEHVDATQIGGPSVADGLYQVTPSVLGTDGLEESAPFWLVYNRGLDEALHDEAIDWVIQNRVPEPGCVLMAAGGAVFLGRRRRKHAPAPVRAMTGR